jgi:hypothetical protein
MKSRWDLQAERRRRGIVVELNQNYFQTPSGETNNSNAVASFIPTLVRQPPRVRQFSLDDFRFPTLIGVR